MDANSFFRKLSSGAKFNFKRFSEDAKTLQLVPKPKNNINELNISEDTDHAISDAKNRSRKQHTMLSNDGDITFLRKRLGDGSETKGIKRKKKAKKSAEKLAELRQEEINHFRNQWKIHIWGSDVPPPVETFEQLQKVYGIYSDIMECVGNVGYTTPTPIQMQAIPIMLDRREILACAPTGSGKTAAFLIPVIQHLKEPRKSGFRAVIVSPTRELAKQTHRECERLCEGRGLRVHIINKVNAAIQKFGLGAAKKFDILVTTPNRLVYLLHQEPPAVNLKNVEWLIVDESDKLFEAGRQGFRDQLGIIYKACDSSNVRRAMFSATFAYDVEEWCKLNLDNVVTVSIGARNTAVDLVKQELLFVGNELGKLIAFRDIIKKGLSPPMLVFVQTKERAKELFNELIYDGINVEVIHSERTQLQRDNVVKSFRLGKIWVLICTELMGRGIDFKGVNIVVNYDFPPSAISYIHRIGRTGRAGRSGHAVTFFTEDDVLNLRSIAQVMRNAGCEVPEFMLQLKKPNKKIKKKIMKSAPKRERISTIPQYDLEKEEKKRKMIQKSKERKKRLQKNVKVDK